MIDEQLLNPADDPEHNHELGEGRTSSSRRPVGLAAFQCFPFILVESVRAWWKVTTDSDFLQSKISRRGYWKKIIPALSLIFFCVDAPAVLVGEGQKWWLLVDLAFLACSWRYAVSTVKADNLWVDMVLGFLLGVYAALLSFVDPSADHEGTAASGTPAPTSCQSGAFGMLPVLYMMVCAFFLGVHSALITVIWLISAACCFWKADMATLLCQELWCTSFLAAGFIGSEYTLASLYREWQVQLLCNQKLLDGCTDGFGVVDCITGVVKETSPKMQETLRVEGGSLVGYSIRSVVDARDHAVLGNFFGDFQGAVSPEPVLVTCYSRQVQQDVRMVPFQLQGSEIGFALQKVGEARTFKRTPSSSASSMQAAEGREAHSDAAVALAGAVWSSQGSTPGNIVVADVDVDDSASQMIPHPRPPSELEEPLADAHPFPAAGVEGAQSTATTTSTDDVEAAIQQVAAPAVAAPSRQRLQALALPRVAETLRSLGSLSLSSWTVSLDSGSTPAAPPPKRVVETRTLGVQTLELPAAAPSAIKASSKPPAPLAASTAPPRTQDEARERKRMKKIFKAAVVEGKPHLERYKATPRATRGSALRLLVQSFNSDGKGCCQRHILWMDLHRLVVDELRAPCGSLGLCMDWQCPSCLGLNDLEDEDEDVPFQMCCLCRELVKPSFAGEAAGAAHFDCAAEVGSDAEQVADAGGGSAASSSEGSDADSDTADPLSSSCRLLL